MFNLMRIYVYLFFIATVVSTFPSKTLDFTSEDGVLKMNGQMINLKGLSWYGFQAQTGIFQGLWGNTYDFFFDIIQSNGFNAMRLPMNLDLMLHDGKHGYTHDVVLNNKTSLEALDFLIDEAGRRGILIMLDMHCLDNSGTNKSPVWFNDKFTELDAIEGWTRMARRYKDTWNVFAIDVFNEPFGGTWAEGKDTDMDAFVVRVAKAVHNITEWLIFVEGTFRSPNCSADPAMPVSCGYGDNLKGVKNHPVRIEKQNKIVYTPHTYGPANHPTRPEFHNITFPENMPGIWDNHWGYIKDFKENAVMVGEWGGPLDTADSLKWVNKFLSYLSNKGIRDTFYWALNPDKNNGGLLLNWSTPDQDKMKLLAQLQPNPTKFTQFIE